MQNDFVLNLYGRAYGSLERWQNSLLCVNRFHIPVGGSAIYTHAHGKLELKPGYLYFLPNGYARDFELKPYEIYDHLYIDFQTFPPILGTTPVEIDLSSDELIRASVSALREVITQYNSESNSQKKQIKAILELLVRHLRVHYYVNTVDNKKLEQAILFIEEHYREPIGNDDIAKSLHIDTRHLIRIFQKYMHMPPYQYLIQCRIEHSLTELRLGKTAAETAYLCGYQTENAFRIAFKKIMGCPPGEYIQKSFSASNKK